MFHFHTSICLANFSKDENFYIECARFIKPLGFLYSVANPSTLGEKEYIDTTFFLLGTAG